MKLAEITVHVYGPLAEHNFPCPVCRIEHAVLNLSIGVMEPCWKCQDQGWRTFRFMTFVGKLFMKWMGEPLWR